jgi:hypothetical protein
MKIKVILIYMVSLFCKYRVNTVEYFSWEVSQREKGVDVGRPRINLHCSHDHEEYSE